MPLSTALQSSSVRRMDPQEHVHGYGRHEDMHAGSIRQREWKPRRYRRRPHHLQQQRLTWSTSTPPSSASSNGDSVHEFLGGSVPAHVDPGSGRVAIRSSEPWFTHPNHATAGHRSRAAAQNYGTGIVPCRVHPPLARSSVHDMSLFDQHSGRRMISVQEAADVQQELRNKRGEPSIVHRGALHQHMRATVTQEEDNNGGEDHASRTASKISHWTRCHKQSSNQSFMMQQLVSAAEAVASQKEKQPQDISALSDRYHDRVNAKLQRIRMARDRALLREYARLHVPLHPLPSHGGNGAASFYGKMPLRQQQSTGVAAMLEQPRASMQSLMNLQPHDELGTLSVHASATMRVVAAPAVKPLPAFVSPVTHTRIALVELESSLDGGGASPSPSSSSSSSSHTKVEQQEYGMVDSDSARDFAANGCVGDLEMKERGIVQLATTCMRVLMELQDRLADEASRAAWRALMAALRSLIYNETYRCVLAPSYSAKATAPIPHAVIVQQHIQEIKLLRQRRKELLTLRAQVQRRTKEAKERLRVEKYGNMHMKLQMQLYHKGHELVTSEIATVREALKTSDEEIATLMLENLNTEQSQLVNGMAFGGAMGLQVTRHECKHRDFGKEIAAALSELKELQELNLNRTLEIVRGYADLDRLMVRAETLEQLVLAHRYHSTQLFMQKVNEFGVMGGTVGNGGGSGSGDVKRTNSVADTPSSLNNTVGAQQLNRVGPRLSIFDKLRTAWELPSIDLLSKIHRRFPLAVCPDTEWNDLVQVDRDMALKHNLIKRSLGCHPSVPRPLQFSGWIRRLEMTAEEAMTCIFEIWSFRSIDDRKAQQRNDAKTSFVDFLDAYMMARFGNRRDLVLEYMYSLLDVVQRHFVDQDFYLFLKVFHCHIHERHHYDQNLMIVELKRTLSAPFLPDDGVTPMSPGGGDGDTEAVGGVSSGVGANQKNEASPTNVGLAGDRTASKQPSLSLAKAVVTVKSAFGRLDFSANDVCMKVPVKFVFNALRRFFPLKRASFLDELFAILFRDGVEGEYVNLNAILAGKEGERTDFEECLRFQYMEEVDEFISEFELRVRDVVRQRNLDDEGADEGKGDGVRTGPAPSRPKTSAARRRSLFGDNDDVEEYIPVSVRESKVHITIGEITKVLWNLDPHISKQKMQEYIGRGTNDHYASASTWVSVDVFLPRMRERGLFRPTLLWQPRAELSASASTQGLA